MTDSKIIGVAELLAWLKVDLEFIKEMRRGRDGTHFPPPILGMDGLAWYEDDVCAWLGHVADIVDWRASGFDPKELTPPNYLAVEPESKKVKR